MRLEGKCAVITGAGAGIGEAAARLFVREGARVLVADRDGDRAEAVAASLGGAAVAFAGDVSRSGDVRAMIALARSRLGRIDVLVNNAGYGIRGTVVSTEEDAWDALMAVNVKGVYLCCRHAIPVMAEQGGGAIVSTASNVAAVGIADRAAYVASKGAVAALTRAMALDHAEAGIRVNCVAPGVTRSTYFDRMIAEHDDPDGFVAALGARSPMNRMAQPAEIANVMLWLASDEASFVTGAMYTVDGGMTAW
ncbi:SDR family oxidoreductase [uncultured Methylobacterium sp.]|jgi:NAD(P)-dependent dehydrogenase (short-subunit alcohol dehydrogenase family)|uniref:SDR family oxidoreductase n=1 Tax=uncultured Methylobacterium sp. TaxID=157278 RepID=UPI0026289D72|nr:SDR family oxidoreductase [uncultured Methylobacterium sp.]